jgi:hypothetical protein
MKLLSIALVAVALAACDLGASSPSAEPLPSVGLESTAASMAPASVGASASASASGETSMTCQDAFASLDVSSLTELDSVSDSLDATIAACSDVAEWEAALTALAPTLNLEEAEAFLAARCETSDVLSDAAICDEIDM